MDPISIIFFVFSIFLCAFFAGTEMALMSISQHKIEWLIKEKKSWALLLKKIKSKNDKLLITIQIWVTLVNVATSWIATIEAIGIFKQYNIPEHYALGIVTWVVTFLILVFWEIIPKSLCLKYSERISLAVAPIYVFLMFIMTPITFLIEIIVKLSSFITGSDKISSSITSEELEAFIDMSRAEWAVEKDEHKQIKWILDLWETEASSIMTPRIQVEFANMEMTINQVCDLFLKITHSRLPVSNKNRDNVDYMITFREAFTFREKWLWGNKLRELRLTKILKVPITQPIDAILEIFKKSHKHIALVMDEYGWVAWIISLEDIIEEVFGDIKDENDIEEIYIKNIWKDKLLVKWTVTIDDILEEFELEMSEIWLDEDYIWETISYIVTSELERFPESKEELEFKWEGHGLKIIVWDVTDNKIEELTIEKISL